MDKLKRSEYNGRMAMEALWDSLLYEDGEIDTPKWHKEIIDERNKKISKVRSIVEQYFGLTKI